MVCFMHSWRSHIFDVLALCSSVLSRTALRLLHSRHEEAAYWEPRSLTEVFHSARDMKTCSLLGYIYLSPIREIFPSGQHTPLCSHLHSAFPHVPTAHQLLLKPDIPPRLQNTSSSILQSKERVSTPQPGDMFASIKSLTSVKRLPLHPVFCVILCYFCLK